MDTMTTRVTAESLEEMPRRKRGDEGDPVQDTVPITIRIPVWMLDEMEATSDREQRPFADIVKRLLSRALRAGWTSTFEATPLTDDRADKETGRTKGAGRESEHGQ